MPIEFDYSHVHHLLHTMKQANKLFHFVKGSEERAKAIMADILLSKTLRGGSGFIRGGYEVICLGELPLTQLSHYLADPNALDQEYRALGVIVDKHWFFHQGGRPVVYQPAEEFDLLHDEMKHLHMPYHPDDEYDFSWIREWRLKGSAMDIDLDHALAVFPNRAWKRDVLAMAREREPGADLHSWESVCLADLGLSVLEQ